MRTLTLLFSLMVTFPFVLSAQTAGELLQKVSAALSEGQDDYVVSLFRQAIAAGADSLFIISRSIGFNFYNSFISYILIYIFRLYN